MKALTKKTFRFGLKEIVIIFLPVPLLIEPIIRPAALFNSDPSMKPAEKLVC